MFPRDGESSARNGPWLSPPPVPRRRSRPAAPAGGAWTCLTGLGPSADLVHPRQTAIRRRPLTNDRAGAERQAPDPGATSATARTVPLAGGYGARGWSPAAPHTTWPSVPVERRMYQVPLVGRKTARSALPAPS